jgi:signal transduction histidine kinase/ActR/RegA family two-component response regulator
MAPIAPSRLLAFARELQRANTFQELLEVTRQEAITAVGYPHVWLFLTDEEQAKEARLIDFAGSQREQAWELAPVLKVEGDALMEEIVRSDEPVVVEDARTDPRTNKEIVAALGNRTIVNIPLRLVDKPFAAFGLGTFGDEEGCRPPTPEQLDYLVGMGSQLSVAASRIRLLEANRRTNQQRLELERRVLEHQKLESLGLLAGGVAHDFNNLLTVIMSGTELARIAIGGSKEKAVTELDAVLGAAERARDLTRQLLAMSRSQPLSLRPLDLNDRLRQLLGLLDRILSETITIELIEGVRLPLVQGDASQLDQVFMNLCINAREAMPEGGKITIETEQVLLNADFVASHPWAESGRYVLVTVTDTGTGMSREVSERLFEPFFTTKKGRGGTGLGLAVAYGVVRQHRGLIHCYSELGVGSVFKVYLPIFSRVASDIGPSLQGAAPRGWEKILVGEDDPDVRATTVRVLESAGYSVVAAENGRAACRVAAAQHFDLVLLDVIMPEMSCREALKRLRTALPNARYILTSGYTADPSVHELLEDGTTFIEKPYDPSHLLRSIRQVLDAVPTREPEAPKP